MKLAMMPKNPAWLTWAVTIVLLVFGLAGFESGFIAAIVLSFTQVVYFWWRHHTFRIMSVQIRLFFAVLMLLCFVHVLRWLYWLPTLGTSALIVFGYCPLARFLSLMPWNRREPLTAGLLMRTFFSSPVITRMESFKLDACGGENGVCELEARAASFTAERV